MQGPPEDAAAPVAPDAEAGEAVVVTEIVTSGDAAEPVIEASGEEVDHACAACAVPASNAVQLLSL